MESAAAFLTIASIQWPEKTTIPTFSTQWSATTWPLNLGTSSAELFFSLSRDQLLARNIFPLSLFVSCTIAHRNDKIPPLPIARDAVGVAATGSVLFAVGGLSSEGATKYIHAFDPMTQKWTEKTPMEVKRYGAGVCMDEECKYLYVLGGSDGNGCRLNSCERYDIEMDKWEKLPSLPGRRCMGGTTCNSTHLYILGGYGGDEEGFHKRLNTVERMDLVNKKWEEMKSMATRRGYVRFL